MNASRPAPDRLLLVGIGLLALMGLSFVLSSSYHAGEVEAGDAFFYFKRHLIAVIGGFLFFMAGLRLNLAGLEEKPWFDRTMGITVAAVAIGILVLVFVPGIGRSAGGSRRWINLVVFQVQASEVAKVLLLFFLAWTLAKKKEVIGEFGEFVKPMAVSLLVVALIGVEPDLSTALLAMGLVFFLFILARTPPVYLVAVGVVCLMGVVFMMQRKAYIVNRFSFLNPYLDPNGAGYHLIQSFNAFARGGLLGVGPGNSLQKLGRLPEAHTDFVYAIIGEELGLLGGTLVMVLFGILAWRGIRTALMQTDAFRCYLAAGITYLVAVQALLHMAVNLGLMPTTGLPLPFISYGRSDMLSKAFMLGLLLNLSRTGIARSPSPGNHAPVTLARPQ